MKRIAQNLLLLGVTCGLTLGVGELIARQAYTTPWYMQLLGVQQRNQKHPYELNQWGLRDIDYGAKQPGDTRVFLIGDSFTFGLGVKEDAFIMPALLEQSLGAEVLNGGISGSHTNDWVQLLERVGPSFEPDLVTAVFFLRDGTLLDAMGSFFKPIRDSVATRNQKNIWYRHVYLYRTLRDELDRRRVGALYSTSLTRAYTGDSSETVEWQAAQRNLLAMKAMAAKRNAKFALVIWPILADLDAPAYPFQAICDVLTDFARRNDIPVHNLLDAFRGEQGPTLWVSPFDQHPNAAAHRIAARGIEPFIRQLLGARLDTTRNVPRVYDTAHHRVRVSMVARGLEHPWGLAFLPDGRLLVSERPGRLRLVDGTGHLSPPLRGVPRVFVDAEGGLLDVALDPRFAENQLVYLTYARPDGRGASTALGRGRLAGDSLEGFTDIFVQDVKPNTNVHFGSRIAFADDSTLFMTLGERGQRARAQDPSVLLGQVIRIRRDGSSPPDNPFVGQKGHRPETWTSGHRNPQGIALEPGTGRPWTVEHGPRGGDELNVERKGHNYGWPIISYGTEYSGKPVGSGTAKDGLEQPVRHWEPSIAPSGITFYTGDKFPAWRGNLLVGAMMGQSIVRLEIQGDSVVKEERMLKPLYERIRAVKQAPDGTLYLITDSPNGRIFHVEPAGASDR